MGWREWSGYVDGHGLGRRCAVGGGVMLRRGINTGGVTLVVDGEDGMFGLSVGRIKSVI